MNANNKSLLDYVLRLMYRAFKHFLNSKYGECVGITRYGKTDTLGLDTIPEIIYIDGMKIYDPAIVFVSEETDEATLMALPDNSDPKVQPVTLISDPIDRSKFLKKYLEELFKEYVKANSTLPIEVLESVKIKDLIERHGSVELWHALGASPVAVTGATSAISCVSKGKMIFTAIVNYITGDLYLASDAGIYMYSMANVSDEKDMSTEKIFQVKNSLLFAQMDSADIDACKKFTTFTGKSGYEENLRDSNIFRGDVSSYLKCSEPGGPSRVLYLSALQDPACPLGFIMYNGEKITEWIHALSFVKFAKSMDGSNALNIYEISIERSWSKNGILMSTHPAYSIFIMANGRSFMDLNKLKYFDSPSHYRSMLVISPRDNHWINLVMRQLKYRDISACL